MVHTSDGFDPNAYKLMEESGSDFRKPPSSGYVIDIKPYGPNREPKMVQEQGDETVTPRIVFGYMPSQLVKISR